MAATLTPPWQAHPPSTHPTPFHPAHVGRPPGNESGWVAEDEGFGWDLSNSSLIIIEDDWENSTHPNFTTQNKTQWGPGVMVMGVEVEVFPEWVVGVWTGILVTLMVVGVGGNVLVPVVVIRTRDLRSSTNFLLVNLAAADLLVLLVSLPTALIELHSRPETWVLGEPMCKLVPFLEYCVSHASVLTILVISFERYYAICRPLRASYTCTKMRACTCILTIWASAIMLSCPMMIMSKHMWVPYADGSTVPGCYTELTTFWACLYINLVTAVFFFVPLVLLVLLYLVIGRSLMQDSASAALQHRKVDLPNMKARKQVVVMLATVTIFFFVSLFPFRVLTLWIVWTPKEAIENMGALRFFSLLYGARVLFFANSAVNPILYNLTSTKFREAFLKLLVSRETARRHLSRQSTFNTTGTSMSNGRSGSTRHTDATGFRESHSVRVSLARCGRHASFDDVPSSRPSMARYGRQSSFAGSYGFPSSTSNSISCSRQNSKAGENGNIGSLEGRREGEKRNSGEGRRLLERDRSASQGADMIEEERVACGAARSASIKSRCDAEAESENLLTQRAIPTSPFTHDSKTGYCVDRSSDRSLDRKESLRESVVSFASDTRDSAKDRREIFAKDRRRSSSHGRRSPSGDRKGSLYGRRGSVRHHRQHSSPSHDRSPSHEGRERQSYDHYQSSHDRSPSHEGRERQSCDHRQSSAHDRSPSHEGRERQSCDHRQSSAHDRSPSHEGRERQSCDNHQSSHDHRHPLTPESDRPEAREISHKNQENSPTKSSRENTPIHTSQDKSPRYENQENTKINHSQKNTPTKNPVHQNRDHDLLLSDHVPQLGDHDPQLSDHVPQLGDHDPQLSDHERPLNITKDHHSIHDLTHSYDSDHSSHDRHHSYDDHHSREISPHPHNHREMSPYSSHHSPRHHIHSPSYDREKISSQNILETSLQ